MNGGWPAHLRRVSRRAVLALALAAGVLVAAAIGYRLWPQADPAPQACYDRGENALWLQRQWLHEGAPPGETVAVLVERLRRHGIRRVYPFLGPMNSEGHPGWRGSLGHVPYERAWAEAFLAELAAAAPEVRVLPWTGGRLTRDVRFESEERIAGFLAHCRWLVAAGAHGVHINIEPLPDGRADFLAFLRRVKATIGPERTLSVAAYAPRSWWHPLQSGRWSMDYAEAVAREADELAFMAYDTSCRLPKVYTALVADWTRRLAARLPPPSAGGAEILIGLPSYEDETSTHRPRVENLAAGLAGVRRALAGRPVPEAFRGVAIYADWTTDEEEWAAFERLWRCRGASPFHATPPGT